MKFLVTGGAGFIGSCLVRHLVEQGEDVVTVDSLTYAGHLESLQNVMNAQNHSFFRTDIRDADGLARVFAREKPDYVMHLAAESHVDRSIESPKDFVTTNVLGTVNMLGEATKYWQNLPSEGRNAFRFIHVSTDEVYGSLGRTGLFSESTPYQPNSPYSASKASSDHFVRAWNRTFGLPVVTSHCSNNYGPYQLPEKLIPVTILAAIEGRPIPVYGDGSNVRDWLFVDDHVRALELIARNGQPGRVYNIGADEEVTNLEIVRMVCEILDGMLPQNSGSRFDDLVAFVEDRPGHDLRYAIDSQRIRNELGWRPLCSLRSGMELTVRWYLENAQWLQRIRRSGLNPESRRGLSAAAE